MTPGTWIKDANGDIYYIIKHWIRDNYLTVNHQVDELNVLSFYHDDDNPYTPREMDLQAAIKTVFEDTKLWDKK